MARKKKREYSSPVPISIVENFQSDLNKFDIMFIMNCQPVGQELASFTFSLNEKQFIKSDNIYVYYTQESTECFLCWEEHNEAGKLMKCSYASCTIPFDVLNGLASPKIFSIIWNNQSLNVGNISACVNVNAHAIYSLNYAAQPICHFSRKCVKNVVEYFFGFHAEEYEKEVLKKEIPFHKVYDKLENCYNPQKIVNICHDSLVPKLRQYQSQAIQWMLKCESETDFSNPDQLHSLYCELILNNEYKLYYHKYGGFFVNQKFSSQPRCRGGILADEMGLGKTVEVISCILLNPRKLEDNNAEASELDMFKTSYNVIKMATEETNEAVNKIDAEFYKSEKRKKRSYFECICGSRECKDKEIKCGLLQHAECVESLSSPKNYKCQYCFESSQISSDHENYTFKVDSFFECVCGSDYCDGIEEVIECVKCGLLQHPNCVLHNSKVQMDDYICPYCLVNDPKNVVKSRATLIVTPSIILHQWEEEIAKHVKKDLLKVFTYSGVSHHRFIHPLDLANFDIILTAYETFRTEINHIDLPHGENRCMLRYRKKFRSIPSPLLTVEWWRICLDEAQMVENITGKVAQIVLKLHSINRWCVTGTPIQKSFQDLYGLLVFLGFDPYHVKCWWYEMLWKPFINGHAENLIAVLNKVLWRTEKNKVIDQMGIPPQQTVLYKLEFSPIEKVYYDNTQEKCKHEMITKVEKYGCANAEVKSMNERILTKLFSSLRTLRIACNAFYNRQDRYGRTMTMKGYRGMTIPELHDHLIKTTAYECEEVHRQLIGAINGVAGIDTINKNYTDAAECYKTVLKSIEENKNNIRTDVLQQIHTLYNFSELTIKGYIPVLEDSDAMAEKCEELIESYLQKFKTVVQDSFQSLEQYSEKIDVINLKYKLGRTSDSVSYWWIEILDIFKTNEEQHSFIERLKKYLGDISEGSFMLNAPSIANKFQEISGLKFVLISLFSAVHKTREEVIQSVKMKSFPQCLGDVKSSVDCHLRPVKIHEFSKCNLCRADEVLKRYESLLFRFSDSLNFKEVEEEENIMEEKEKDAILRKGNRADSESELILKFMVNYIRQFSNFSDHFEDGVIDLELLDLLKKEFTAFRTAWLKQSDYIGALDEVEMAKTSMKVLLPGEELLNPSAHILAPDKVKLARLQLKCDIITHQQNFKNKLGKLFYLKNLKKADSMDAAFDESCPVCREALKTSWFVLQCGHNFCPSCVVVLTRPIMEVSHNKISCPVCRETTNVDDFYAIDLQKQQIKDDVEVKGRFSTKVTAVVKCLLKIKEKNPTAKSLVFFSCRILLDVLETALSKNDLLFITLLNKKEIQMHLNEFKTSKTINIMLLPYNLGANGLNIIEATNILLVEPAMDNSFSLQAIGRVHRIGQVKKTTVHEFIVANTIEEKMYNIFKTNCPSMESKDPVFSRRKYVKDMFELFG